MVKPTRPRRRNTVDAVLEGAPGQRHGTLTIQQRAADLIGPNGLPVPMWQCRCTCGRVVHVLDKKLDKAHSCGHLIRQAAEFQAVKATMCQWCRHTGTDHRDKACIWCGCRDYTPRGAE